MEALSGRDNAGLGCSAAGPTNGFNSRFSTRARKRRRSWKLVNAVIGFAGPSVDRFQHPIDTRPANAERLGDRCGPDVGTNCGDEAWLLCGAVEKPTDNNLAVFRHSD